MRLVWAVEPESDDADDIADDAGDYEDLVWSEDWEVSCVHVSEGARVAQQLELTVRGMSFEVHLCRNCRRLAA
jgi:hypothetical protein